MPAFKSSRWWWIVRIASVVSNVALGSGSASAAARTTGAIPGGRRAIMAADGSIAMTCRDRTARRSRSQARTFTTACRTECRVDANGHSRVGPTGYRICRSNGVPHRKPS
jgi:hypothetical protein